jgi:NhaA family Na+:H+ antiporter
MELRSTLKEFFDHEKAGGIILICCTVVSMILANLYQPYALLWHSQAAGMDLTHWINDGLMAVFFLLVGLELKREFLAGELSNVKKAVTPIFAAIGGVVTPAMLYLLLNSQSGDVRGVGIPMATDVVFALGVLSLLGNRVPISIKIFLTALAVIDDMCAILVIAVFYSQAIDLFNLSVSLAVMVALVVMNKMQVKALVTYIISGMVVWYFMLHSGVHASITGVLLALVIPFNKSADHSPAQYLQSFLHKPVAFFILPLFALANTSIEVSLETFSSLLTPISLGIIAGLLLGKPLGIYLFSFIAVKIGFGSLPLALKWKHIAGIGFLGGIGFTISIFMSVLAFDEVDLIAQSKFSVLIASFVAGSVGYIYLKRVLKTQD